jgi:FkbM family methyltransferase
MNPLKVLANKLLANYGYAYNFLKVKFLPKADIDLFISQWLKGKKGVTLFQVGANDGISGDPFFRYVRVYKIKNLAVEPIPFLFNKLKDNYTRAKQIDNCILLNMGISHNSSETIYYFEPNPNITVPENIYQLGTFNRAFLNDSSKKFPELKIVAKEVPTVTVSHLQNTYFSPDVMHIDTEGFDFEVIKTIDFAHSPRLIVFEYIHLSENDLKQVKSFLEERHYKLTSFSMDIAAELIN